MDNAEKEREGAIRSTMLAMIVQFLGTGMQPVSDTIRAHVCPWRLDPTEARVTGAVAFTDFPEAALRHDTLCEDLISIADRVLRAAGHSPEIEEGVGLTITIELYPSKMDAPSRRCAP